MSTEVLGAKCIDEEKSENCGRLKESPEGFSVW